MTMALLGALVAAMLLGAPPASAGILPHEFRGGITVNGANAVASTTWVFAEIDGVLYGQDSTVSPTAGGGYSGSEYAIKVSGDQFEPADPKQGGVPGDTIVFWVVTGGGGSRYVAAASATYAEGAGPDVLNLAVTTANNPTWPLLSEVNPANSSNDWVELFNPGTADLILSAGWSIASEGPETPVSLAGVVVPAGGYSNVFNVSDLNLFDDPVAQGDVVRLLYSNPALGGGAPIVVDRLEYGNPLKPADAMGRAREAGAATCVADLPSSACVWDVNVAGTGSAQTFTAGRSFVRTTIPSDTDRYDDWGVGHSPNWPAPGASPVVSITVPAAGARLAHGQAQTLIWSASDADNTTAEVAVWINVSYAGPGGPWSNLYTGDLVGTTAPWTPSPTCPPDVATAYLRGEARDGDGNTANPSLIGPITIDCTRPAVTTALPANGTAVAPNAPIDVTFNEAMVQAATQSAFRLDGAAVPGGDVTWIGPNRARVTHGTWIAGSAHDFAILCGAVDVALPNGNALAGCAYTWNWTVTTANTPPSISISAPSGGQVWSMSSPHDIAWTVTDGQDAPAALDVTLEYSNNGGASWNSIVTARAGDQSPYSWNTPSANCGTIILRGTVTDTGALTGPDTTPNLTLDCTGPTVIATDPIDNAAGVTRVKTVRITFSEAMDRAPTQLSVDISPSQPPGLWFDSPPIWQSGDTVLLLGHTILFDEGQTYTVTVRCTPAASAAQDTSDPGNPLAGCPSPYSFQFTVATGNTPPEVILQTPAGGELWSGNTTHDILWTMNDDGGPALLDVSLNYSTDGGTSWNPITSGLTGLTSFTWSVDCIDSLNVKVNATATDADSPALQGFSESAVFGIDCTPPAISSTTPAEGTSAVPTTAPIVIDFNEGIDNSTLAGPCGVTVSPAIGSLTYRWSNGNRTLTVGHGGLATSQGYTVTVCNTIRDLSSPGLWLAGDNDFAFTTGTGGGNTPPTVTVTAPAGGSFVHGQAIVITWTMSDAETASSALAVVVSYRANGGADTGTIATLVGALTTTWTAPSTITASDVTVRVTVTDGGGLPAFDDSAAFSIGADTTDPAATIDGPTTATAGVATGFACTCSDNSGSALTYEWRVLQGGVPVPGANGTGSSFSYAFPAAGTYTVEVVVSDAAGNDATATRDVAVSSASGGFPWWILIPIVLAVLLLLFLLMRRRKKDEPEGAPPPAAPTEAPPGQSPPPPSEFPPPPPDFPPPDSPSPGTSPDKPAERPAEPAPEEIPPG